MYETQIKNLETAIKQLEESILQNPENISDLIHRKVKYHEDLAKLRRLQWEEQTQRLDYGDDR